jgi:hypothetical protein
MGGVTTDPGGSATSGFFTIPGSRGLGRVSGGGGLTAGGEDFGSSGDPGGASAAMHQPAVVTANIRPVVIATMVIFMNLAYRGVLRAWTRQFPSP